MGQNSTRINVDADTSRAKQAIRELADEAKKYNIDASKASGGDVTELKRVLEEIRKEKAKQISDEYKTVRKDAQTEYTLAKNDLRSGKINDTQFEKKRSQYEENYTGSFG